jgi:serpin B
MRPSLLAALLFASFLSGQNPGPDVRLLAQACNRFGAELHTRLAATNAPTCSPGSIAIALTMLLPGAGGTTADELVAVLQLPEELRGERLLVASQQLLASLRTQPGGRPETTTVCELVNDAFVQQGFALAPAYTQRLTEFFGARATAVDFFGNAEVARKTINEHLQRLTHDRIRDLLSADDVTRDTRLVLTNALWCKGPWQTPFRVANTKPGPFTRADGTVVEVPRMHAVSGLPWAEAEGWLAVSLPMAGHQFTVDLVLPRPGQALQAAERALLSGEVAAALQPASVAVTLPKFSLRQKHRLRDALLAMGVVAAFDAKKVDFRGLDPSNSLVLSDVVHEAFVAADEAGFEAAAATAVVMKRGGRPAPNPHAFVADRPFAFALRDLRTGLLLFVGRVADPSVVAK